MQSSVKMILIFLLDVTFSVLLASYFYMIGTISFKPASVKPLLFLWIGIVVIRIILDICVKTPEEEYYKKVTDYIKKNADNVLETQAKIHQKKLEALDRGDRSEFISLDELTKRIGLS